MDDAIRSVIAQSSDQYILNIIDSGRGPHSQEMHNKWANHPKVKWRWTNEPENFRELVGPCAWVFNRAYEWGMIDQKYFCCHYDDDHYFPDFVKEVLNYFSKNPDKKAARVTQRRTIVYPDRSLEDTGSLIADHILTPEDQYDCKVDGMQCVIRSDILPDIKTKYGEIYPEEPELISHSDGIFYERAKEFIPEMGFINRILCQHRATEYSTYDPNGTKLREKKYIND
jgi:hypothetical protein